VVSVLATGPKCCRFEPSQGDGLKKEAKGVPLHAMEALRGRGGIGPAHS
jgi:hypothetical protein